MADVNLAEETPELFELWDLETGNLMESFSDRPSALVAIKEYVEANGESYRSALGLRTIQRAQGRRIWLHEQED